MSNVTHTINKAVIRDAIGRYRLRQCRPVLHYQKPISQFIVAKNRKTIGDIQNNLQYNTLIRSIVRPKA